MTISRIPSVEGGIQPTLLTAKGDLISATAASTVARLAVGSDAQILVADSTASTGLAYKSVGVVNGLTTTGDTIYSSSGTTQARLGIGSTGQVLTVAGGVPSWATPAGGGGMTSIASGSLSGSSTSITSISGSYKNLQLVLQNMKSTSDGTGISMRFNAVSSAQYSYTDLISVASASTGNTSAEFSAYADNTVTGGLSIVNIYDYANTLTYKYAQSNNMAINATTTTNLAINIKQIAWANTAAISQIDIIPNAGTLSGGTYILYGVN
jgi:hypothetical protein